MSRTSRNFVFAYAFLVILPLVGLAGILKSGRHLKAPIAIDGIWKLQVDSAELNSLPCGRMLAAISEKSVAISQSGRSLSLGFSGSEELMGSGKIEGNAIQASLLKVQSSTDAACANGQTLLLSATVDQEADANSLTGTLTAVNCPNCARIAFQAQRQATSQAVSSFMGNK